MRSKCENVGKKGAALRSRTAQRQTYKFAYLFKFYELHRLRKCCRLLGEGCTYPRQITARISLSSWPESVGERTTPRKHTLGICMLSVHTLLDREKPSQRATSSMSSESELIVVVVAGATVHRCLHVNVVNRFTPANEVKTYHLWHHVEKLLRLMDNFVLLARA